MTNDVIKLSEKEYRDLYEGIMAKALKTENEVMSEFGNREQELLYKFIGFTYQILSITGIFAGFGFTAINKVQNLYLFIGGQALLIFSILLGLWWLKRFYESNLQAIQQSADTIFKLYKERDKYYLAIARDFTESQKLKKNNLLLSMEKDQKVLDFISSRAGENRNKKETPPHTLIFITSIIGVILLLSSFFIKIVQIKIL